METHQLILFAILIGAVILLFTEWIRIDLTAILTILALSITGVLTPKDDHDDRSFSIISQ